MKLTTWNVNGLRAREGQLHDWLRVEKPDVVCLQEIKASASQVPQSLLALESHWALWHGAGGYSGVALLLSKSACATCPVFSHPEFDHENRSVVVELQQLVIASLYVPNGGKEFPPKLKFYESLVKFAKATHAKGKQLLLCGDFNVALEPRDVHEKLRNPEQIGQTKTERELFHELLSTGLVDLGRHFAPDDDQLFTWWAPWRNHRERNIGWRLDYVLASQALLPRAKSCKGYREFGTSDHGPVQAVFDGPLFEPDKVTPGAPQKVEEKPGPGAAPKKPQLDLF